MANKEKVAANSTFLIRTGGLALSLPLVLGLAFMLMLLSILLAVIIMGGLLNLGDVSAVVSPYIPWLSLFLAICISTIFVLFRGVFRYTGGINQLGKRLRGIQEENERVERLMEREKSVDEVDISDLNDEQGQEKYQ